jgi:hypothetical protein
METPVEIRYAGVVIARANEVRRMTVGGVDMFLSMPEPLPAGTVVSLNSGTLARIEKVIEVAGSLGRRHLRQAAERRRRVPAVGPLASVRTRSRRRARPRWW